MAENLDIEIKINNSDSSNKLGTLKKQLREAQNEVQVLSDKFGATSEQAIEAAKRAGQLKDAIGDAKSLTDAFNPDAKFKSLTASLSGVAGGFAAVQGAMGLLGVESEDTQKMLLKVQSAMAISQGLQSVGEAVDSFKQLGAVIKSTTLFQSAYNFILGNEKVAVAGNIVALQAKTVATEAQTVATVEQGVATVTTTTAVGASTAAMKAFRIALIASGIGALIIIIGFAVEAFLKFKNSAEDAAAAQEKLNKKIADGAKIQFDAEIKFLENQEKLDIARAKAKGASEQEIFEIEQSYRRKTAEAHQRHYKEVYGKDAKAAQESSDEINKINTDGQVAALENESRIRKEAADKRKADNEKKKEEDKKEQERNNASIKANLDFELQIQIDANKAEDDLAEKKKQAAIIEDERNIASMKATADFEVQLANDLLAIEDESLKRKKEFKEIELEADRQLQEAKYENAKNALYLLEGLAGKNEQLANIIFAISKALEIGKIITSTASAIAEVKAGVAAVPAILPPGIPNPMFGAAVGIGAGKIAALKIGAGISIASIVAASIAKFKGGASGDVTTGSISTTAPMTPQLPQAQMTQLNRQTINDIGNQAVRAYVIETDVTSNQERMAAIRQRARFS